MEFRDNKGRFAKLDKEKWRVKSSSDHQYCADVKISVVDQDEYQVNDVWRSGRRLEEWEVLLSNLEFCKQCRLGPVPLTLSSIKGELQKGLGGYLYVKCQNIDCGFVNTVAYGKTYHDTSRRGMPCFAVNTKLGAAMIDSLGGPRRVNNLLSVLNLKTVSDKSLKKMEERAGEVIETISHDSTRTAAQESFRMEMEAIANQESLEAQATMDGIIEDLGVCPLPGESPSLGLKLQDICNNSGWSDVDDDTDTSNDPSSKHTSRISSKHTMDTRHPFHIPLTSARKSKSRIKLTYPCRTRTGMSAAVDTAWHKRGFDSLTSHTFFMSTGKSCEGQKKVIKTVVGHRTCGVCSWLRRRRPGQKVRQHTCVRNHSGSARAMEATSGVQGVRELMKDGRPVEFLEGDGDNTLISRLKSDLNITMKKRYDKNHVVKNFTKSLYAVKAEKGVKLSKIVIQHLEKCIKYAFAKNKGYSTGMEENLKAILPHQFGDHTYCKERFCGYKRRPAPGVKYIHASLPYKVPLRDDCLRERLQPIFDRLICNAHQYTDLGSSQQCEHANKEVTLRAPKSHHYGNSKSLDYRVHATAAFVNEGRHYISKVAVQFDRCLFPDEEVNIMDSQNLDFLPAFIRSNTPRSA